jgi:hypothetical protein
MFRIGDRYPDCSLEPNMTMHPDNGISTSHNKLLTNLSEKLNTYLKNEAQNNKEHESDM